jgi:chromosome segregation ATPase
MSEQVGWIIGILTVLCTLYATYDMWRKRRTSPPADVVSSAVELLKPYQEEVKTLRTDLNKANQTIRILNNELEKAQTHAELLNSQLADAQAEVGFLKVQVRTMSIQLRDANGGP